MSEPANVLPEGDIEAMNVRPAFEASLQHGATESEIYERVGWTRAELELAGATVSGESTYAHMELMHGKPGYGDFVLAATALHTLSSLGIVGLACKTAATVGEALACHRRFQHLTNRTAEYRTHLEAGQLAFVETRPGKLRLGSQLISDYTMLIALQLLRTLAAQPPVLICMRSRRSHLGEAEREAYERFLGAKIELGAPHAQLLFDPSIVDFGVSSADAELTAYFRGVLERAAPFSDQPELLREVRRAIRDRLALGTPTAADVARALGVGQRTLQRRLSEHDETFAGLLESTRQALSEGYLADERLSIGEVGYLLGYTEQASFFRAFKRWHGTTPAAYRQTAQPTA